MKFHGTSLESVRVLEVNECNFLPVMAIEDGYAAIVMPGKNDPTFYKTLDQACVAVDEIMQVSYTPDAEYAYATVA